jgi:hypothetical protein
LTASIATIVTQAEMQQLREELDDVQQVRKHVLHLCQSIVRLQAQQSETSLVYVHENKIGCRLLHFSLGSSTATEISSEASDIRALHVHYASLRSVLHVLHLESIGHSALAIECH